MQPGDTRRFFQHLAPFCRFRRDHPGNLALADKGRRMRAGRGIGKDQRDILRPHIAPVQAIGAARAAFDPAGDFQFLTLIRFGVQDNFGEIAGRALRRAGEDHIFHPATAHGFGRIFAHDPADRFKQIGFAAAVRADDAGQPGFNAQFGRLDKALESAELEPADAHPVRAPSTRQGHQRAPACCSAASTSGQPLASSFAPLSRNDGVPSMFRSFDWVSD